MEELEKHVADMFPTSESLWYDSGRIAERTAIIKMISDRICFDNKAGSCEHRTCYSNAELVEVLRGESKATDHKGGSNG